MRRERLNRYVIWAALLLLVVLHQDYWQWNNSTLLFGFLPYTLAYHAALSLLAAAIWWVAATWFWPTDLEYSGPDTVDTAAAGGNSSGGRHA